MTLLQIADESLARLAAQAGTDEFAAVLKTLRKLSFRLLIDLISVFALSRFVYFKMYRRSDLFFTFFVFNLVIFLICFLLNKVDLSMGAAFGLFAVFSMLRYRTEDISIKDMSYLFLVIAIGLISAVSKIMDTSELGEYLFLAVTNLLIILIALAFESSLLFRREEVQVLIYENTELLKADKKEELIQDIRFRTGLNVHRVSIGKIDFQKSSAVIRAYYFQEELRS